MRLHWSVVKFWVVTISISWHCVHTLCTIFLAGPSGSSSSCPAAKGVARSKRPKEKLSVQSIAQPTRRGAISFLSIPDKEMTLLRVPGSRCSCHKAPTSSISLRKED